MLRGALFDGADLRGVRFGRCDLTNTDFTGVLLRDADLRGSIIDGLKAGPRELQGAIIDPAQAIQVAQLFGLIIQTLDDE